MEKINFRRILAFVGIISLVLYFSLSWFNLLADPDQRTGSDFMGVYVFGRITQTIGIQHLYDIAEHKRIEEHVVGHPVTPIFYTHLPFMAPIAAAIVDPDYLTSFKRWALLLLLLNALSVYLLANIVELKPFTRENTLILILGAFFFDPTVSGFMNGQDTAFLLLGAAIWAWGMFSKRYFLAGLGLSLTTVRPQAALLLAIPFLLRHRNVFWGFVLGSSVLAGLSLWLLKMDGTLKFLASLRYIERTIWVEPHSFDMPTISGIIRRNFTVTDPAFAKTFVWTCYLAGLIGFCVWWYKSDEIDERQVGLITLASIFLLPYAHYHELTLLLIPIFCVIRMLQRQNTTQQYYLAVLPLVVSWLSALGFLGSGLLKFPIIYFVMFALAYLLITSGKTLQRIPRLSTQQ
jgi:Glycosyltransferase family 87